MSFKLPDLNYDYNTLEPYIDAIGQCASTVKIGTDPNMFDTHQINNMVDVVHCILHGGQLPGEIPVHTKPVRQEGFLPLLIQFVVITMATARRIRTGRMSV